MIYTSCRTSGSNAENTSKTFKNNNCKMKKSVHTTQKYRIAICDTKDGSDVRQIATGSPLSRKKFFFILWMNSCLYSCYPLLDNYDTTPDNELQMILL